MGIRDLRMSVMVGSTQQGHASSQPRRTRQIFFKVATVQLEESSPCQGTESILGCGGLLAAFTSLAVQQKLDCFLPDWDMPEIIQAKCIQTRDNAQVSTQTVSYPFHVESQNRTYKTHRHSFP